MTRPEGAARAARAAAGLVGALLLVGCDAVKEPVAGVPSPEPIQKPVDDRCTDPPEPLVATVAERLTVDAVLEHPKVVTSEKEPGLHFLSAEVVGTDVPETPPVGTWVVRGPLDAADPTVQAVGAVGNAYSDWPDGTRGADAVSLTDDGGKASIVCVESAAKK